MTAPKPPPFLRERAVALHRAGDLAGAEPLYRLLLDAGERDPELLYLVALLRFGQGRPAEAVAAARTASRAAPGDAGPHALAGLAEAGRGRPAAALAAYDRALRLAPDRWDVEVNRAAALTALGRPAEALAGCDRALLAEPDAAEAHAGRGDALHDLGRPAEALAAYAAAEGLGLAAAGARRDGLLAGRGPAEGAALLAEAADRLAADGRVEAALDAMARASALRPEDVGLLNRRAVLLGEAGRLDGAVDALGRAVALAPGDPVLFHNIGLFGRFARGHPHLDALAAIDPAVLDARGAAYLHFARARAAADLGDPDGAFAELERGNALVRAGIAHDPGHYERLAERVRAAAPPAASPRGAEAAPRPVFVVGLPRSGSTLIERVLSGHPDAFAAGEVDAFRPALEALAPPLPFPECGPALTPADLARLAAGYRERLPRAPRGARVVVDKTLVNLWHVGLIHAALPEARFVHAMRDPLDAGLSCFEQLFNTPQPFAYDLVEFARYARAATSVMAHWRAVLPPGTLLDLAYEELVRDPEPQARRLLAHCGLGWHPGSLDLGRPGGRVSTASAAQVRRPISTASVGRWRSYARHLGPLLDALGLDALGLDAEGRPVSATADPRDPWRGRPG